MNAAQDHKLPSLVIYSPVVLACVGLLLLAAYHAQRAGAFLHSFYTLDRFIQHHLDGIAGWSLLCAVAGVLAGLVIRRFESRRAVMVGTLLSIVALLWSTLFLSL